MDKAAHPLLRYLRWWVLGLLLFSSTQVALRGVVMYGVPLAKPTHPITLEYQDLTAFNQNQDCWQLAHAEHTHAFQNPAPHPSSAPQHKSNHTSHDCLLCFVHIIYTPLIGEGIGAWQSPSWAVLHIQNAVVRRSIWINQLSARAPPFPQG